MTQRRLPEAQGLYDPANEHDACGVGFVANIKGEKTNDIIRRGLQVNVNMTHRGAEGADNKSGDGAGILIQMPHEFFKSVMPELPDAGKYASGLIFLPKNEAAAQKCIETLDHFIQAEGLETIGYRNVPVDSSCVGEIALRNEPKIMQVFIRNHGEETDKFERKLYLIRKQAEIRVRNSNIIDKESYYVVSLSSRTFIYKGMLTPKQLGEYFLDLKDPKMKSAIAVVHSRFSTNTFPTWDLAQPFRMLAHNGEINTIRGNRLWMQAREGILQSDLFGDDLKKVFPIVEPNMSDSASIDNVF